MLSHHDHRAIGQRLELFHLQDEAPGMVFWHPRGFHLYRQLEEAARRRIEQDGYQEVRTPQVLRRSIWEASGHQANFAHGMFAIEEAEAPPAALKPVSCPGHLQIFGRGVRSHRELPLRLAEFGLVHRNEPSGVLHGLFRLRQFTQDDGHIFCLDHQVVDEVGRFCRSVVAFYRMFGFERVRVGLSLRPAERFGDAARWDRAESMLAEGAESAGLAWAAQPGEGAFYGPKLEFVLEDSGGRAWQCGTIQLDFFMPERFDVSYVDADNARKRPVMLHRAMFGSLERFMGVLLEHHEGRLPAWLAFEQVRVLPVSDAQAGWADAVCEALRAAGVRARRDERPATLPRRIAIAVGEGVPFVLVVGAREQEARSVNLRDAEGGRVMALDDACAMLQRACAAPL